MSDMITVDRRTFQRHTAEWLNRAAAGEEVVIQSRGRPALTLRPRTARTPARSREAEMEEHIRWLQTRPIITDEQFRDATRRDR